MTIIAGLSFRKMLQSWAEQAADDKARLEAQSAAYRANWDFQRASYKAYMAAGRKALGELERKGRAEGWLPPAP